ncbi:MAG: FAD-binding oxidoreductase [Candidatus Peribacteraceae bacterium]|nr:FAD-binding oxidoreductase [Candidatus Peribacteraceae bacterium]
MPVPTHTVRCTRHKKIATAVFEFALEKPKGFTFQAGQFVLFQVPLAGNPQDIQPRAFSIAASPEEGELLFVAKIKEGGRAGRWISEALRVGSAVSFQGPLGAFLLDAKTQKDCLFIATCTGVAPLRSQIVSALTRGDTRRMDLLFGVRSEENMFWKNDFEDLAKRHPNFHVHFALSQPSGAWTGLKGHIQDVLSQAVPDFARRSIYICGNTEMTKEVKALCLAAGTPKEEVHMEGY